MTTTASNMLPGLAAQICPVAPPGAQQYADQLMGYLLWGVGLLFILGVVVGIGAIVGGRAFSMPHASKAGVVALTKSLGKELAKTGIRVNCVTPAAVKTGMFAQMTQSHIDFMLSKIPMGRFGEVEEIAALVTWLCTEDCSFSTGAVFDLSGGRAVY